MKLIDFIYSVLFGVITGTMCHFSLASGIGAGFAGLSILIIQSTERVSTARIRKR